MEPIIIMGDNIDAKTMAIANNYHNEQVAWLTANDLDSGHFAMTCTEQTKCVIVEDIENYDQLRRIISSTHIRVNKRGQQPFLIQPQIVATIQTDEQTDEKWKIYELNRVAKWIQ